ncbi:MAG: hypothetical protein LIO99_02745, partial [Clostridiales bacterium]|nr:hypothetical protein [Clostridiales bacterium]
MVLQQAGITTLADDGTTLAAETAVEESVTEVEASTEDSSNNTSNETTAAEDSSTGTTEAVSTEASAQTTEATASDGTTTAETPAASDENATLETSIEETDSDETTTESEESTEAATDAEAESGSEAETEEATEAEATTEAEETTEAEDATETLDNTEAADTDTDAEEATEAETEAETPKTYFTYSDSRVVITATASEAANLPQDAELVADYITPGSTTYNDAVSKIESQLGSTLGLNDENTETAYVMYDVYFLSNGEEVEPEAGTVSVSMVFRSAVDIGVEGEIINTDVVHIKDSGKAEIVTDFLNVNENGDVTAMGFTQDSFSAVVATVTYTTDEINAMIASAVNMATSGATITVSITANGEAFDSSATYARDTVFEFTLDWSGLSSSIVSAASNTVYYVIPNGVTISGLSEGTFYVLYDSTNTKCGYYYLVGNTVYFIFDSTWLANHDSISGGLTFTGSLSSTYTNDQSSVTVTFPGTGSNITINLESGKVTGSKSYTVNSDGTVTFTITFTVTGESSTVVLTDTLGSNLTFDETSFKLDKTDVSSSVSVSGSVATATLSNLSIGTHTFTYTAKVTEITNLDDTSNKVSWTYTTTSGGTGSGSSEVTVAFQKYTITKTASTDSSLTYLDDDGNLIITWVVTVTPTAFTSLAGVTITDTLTDSDQKYYSNGAMTVVRGGYWPTVVEDVTGNYVANGQFSYTFADSYVYENTTYETSNGVAFTVTYQTIVSTNDLPAAGESEEYYNKVTDESGNTATGKYIYTAPAVDIVSKSGAENTTATDPTITWTITINSGTATVTGFTVTDTLTDSEGGVYVEGTLKVTTKSGSTLTAGNDYTVTWYKSNGDVTTTVSEAAYFIIAFSSSYTFTEEVYITYDVDYSASSNGTITGKNKASSNYTYNGTSTVEEDEKSYDITQIASKNVDKTGTLTGNVADWTIMVNYDSVYNRAAEYLESAVYVITDVIPEGMTLDESSIKGYVYDYYIGTNSTYWVSGTQYNVADTYFSYSYDKTTRTVTFTFDLSNVSRDDCILVVTYSTIIATGTTGTGSSVSYTNNVSVKQDGTDIGNTSATVELKSQTLTKDAALTDSSTGINQVTYTIGVNYSASDLVAGSDWLTLTDTIGSEATLVLSSVSVEEMYTGASVDYSVSYSTNANGEGVLTLTVPDSKALLVTYRVAVSGKEGTTVTVTNEAELTGVVSSEVSTQYEVCIESSDAWVHGTTGSITITKIDSDSITKLLPNATFELFEVTIDSSTYELSETSKKTDTTGNSGTLTFSALSQNTLYYFVETAAPSGYKLDETKHYFVLTDDTTASAYTTLVDLCSSSKANISFATYPYTNGASVNISNTESTGSLTVKKSFAGASALSDTEKA